MTTTTPNGVDRELVQVLKEWLDVSRQEIERYSEEAARYRTRLATLRGITEGELICAVEEARKDRRAFPAMTDAEQRLDDAREEEIHATNAAVLARRTELTAKAVMLAKAVVSRMRDLPADVRGQLGSTAIREIAAGRTEPRESLYDTEPRVPKNVRGALEELELISVELAVERSAAFADGPGAAPDVSGASAIEYGENYAWVRWGNETHTFEGVQRAFVALLAEDRERRGGHGRVGIKPADCLDRIYGDIDPPKTFRIRDYFRAKGGKVPGMHSAWGTMIVQTGPGSGEYMIADPPQESKESRKESRLSG